MANRDRAAASGRPAVPDSVGAALLVWGASRLAKDRHPAGALLAMSAVIPAAALAHGVAPAPPSDLVELLGLWSFDPTVQVPLAVTVVAWIAAVRRVNRAHPSNEPR